MPVSSPLIMIAADAMRAARRILIALLAIVACAAAAQAPWPERPVKQQFVVENMPGGSGNIGAAVAARAAPDGYTFLVSPEPALTVNLSLFRNLPYNAERDFVPVACGVTVPLVLCARASLDVRTL